jgi:ABC-2 type transport system permease protein
VIFTQLQRMEVDAPIELQKDVLQGKQVFSWDGVLSLILPPMAVMFAFFITAAVSTDLLREREAGSLRRLIAAPLPRGSLLGGKILAYTLVVVLQIVIVFGLGVILMDMPLGNSPLGLVLTTLCLGLAATSLGMLVAAFSHSIDQAGSISIILVFVLGFLSGAFSPQIAFYRGEGLMAFLSRYTPQAQATIAYHTMILQNGGLIDILPQIAYLLGLSIVFFVIAIWRFKFE